MADYVAEHVYEFDQNGQAVFKGYKVILRIGDEDCIYQSLDQVPRWLVGLSADFNEPVSAVSWEASKGIFVKPESERGYELSRISWYPKLRQYLLRTDPVIACLLEAISENYPVQPSKTKFENLKAALDFVLAQTPEPPS